MSESPPSKKRKLVECSDEHGNGSDTGETDKPSGHPSQDQQEEVVDEVVTVKAEGNGHFISENDEFRPDQQNHPVTTEAEENGPGEENSEDCCKYMLRWDESSESTFLRMQFRSLYGQGDEMPMTDVSLSSEDGEIVGAHKLVLSICSNYFRRLFLKVTVPNPVVVLTNVNLHRLRLLLEYIYVGHINVSPGELEQFVKIGEMLEIEGFSSISVATEPTDWRQETMHAGSQLKKEVNKRGPPVSDQRREQVQEIVKSTSQPDIQRSLEDEELSEKALSVIKRKNRGRPPLSSVEFHWSQINNVSDEELALNWRSVGGYTGEKKSVRYYNCVHAKQVGGRKRPGLSCSAQLKRVTYHDTGKVVYESNGVVHCQHEDDFLSLQPPRLIDSPRRSDAYSLSDLTFGGAGDEIPGTSRSQNRRSLVETFASMQQDGKGTNGNSSLSFLGMAFNVNQNSIVNDKSF